MELASTFGLDLELDGIWIDTGWDGSGLKWIGQGWKHFPDYFSHGLVDEVVKASVGVYE